LWEDEDSMVNPQRLIEDFYLAAQGEGFRNSDTHSTMLLDEAVEAGWRE
jgi:hypothetical protein